jgi:hypothetical protein
MNIFILSYQILSNFYRVIPMPSLGFIVALNFDFAVATRIPRGSLQNPPKQQNNQQQHLQPFKFGPTPYPLSPISCPSAIIIGPSNLPYSIL